MDKILFRETFSQLQASDEAKKEVLQMTENQNSRRCLAGTARVLVIAAAMMMAMVVTAGAINVATDGALFEKFTVLWIGDDGMMMENGHGEQVYVDVVESDETLITEEDGRLILHADQDIDITDALEKDGTYTYSYTRTVEMADSQSREDTVTVTVTGTPTTWSATVDNGSGIAATITNVENEGDQDADAQTVQKDAALSEKA